MKSPGGAIQCTVPPAVLTRITCLVVTFLATTAHAGPQQEAEALAARSQFVAAAGKFREAYAVEGRPELMCNVGVAYHKAADLPRAQRYLRRCLDLGKDLDRAYMDNAANVLVAIEAQLAAGAFATVELRVQPESARIAIAGDAPFDEPLGDGDRVWFPIGEYRITISADGFQSRQISLRPGNGVHAYVLEALPAAEALHRASVQPRRTSMLGPVIASGATLVVGVSAIMFHLQMRDRAERAGEATDLAERQRLRDEANAARNRTWIAGGLAGAGAVVSGYLWYRWRRTNHALSVDVRGPDGAATVTVGGVW